ncbi:MAG: Fe-S cluster assembly protein SufB [Oscillospiraceae bacterium]|jgi:Fe-S cluster assembly protein SufB|nr:Fe-S cluster assembly protein SufB [Oscillospiraceae bacterium]
MSARELTEYEEYSREVYDRKGTDAPKFQVKSGLTPEIISTISDEKRDPDWMRAFRLQSLEIYERTALPTWGYPLDGLDMANIVTYVRPDARQSHDWDTVPDEIKNTFEALGIPEAERTGLAGVGAQYDSEVVYHSIKQEVADLGVVYTDMDSALRGEYAEMVREHFMKLLPATEHKFLALHGAVWSGGSFVYVPDGVAVDIPLQSYFRFNAAGAGQFEHTLIILGKNASLHFIEGCSAPKYNVANLHAGCVELYVGEGSRLRYSTIENWSRNMYNLNSKRATVERGGTIEWVSGSFGSHTSFLYPMSILRGDDARCEYTGITFAGAGQELDTGTQVAHIGRNTSSRISAKSISKNGGKSTFRGGITVSENAEGSRISVSCDSLMLDSESRSDTVPVIDVRCDDTDIGYEAKIGRISEQSIYYLMSRGLSENDAKGMIVGGFAEPISKELPLEYAVEMNRLISLEITGGVS